MNGDQAETLRLLAGPPKGSAGAMGSEPPKVWIIPHRLVVVVGGRTGAGATTLAVNLVHEAAHRGLRAACLGSEVTRGSSPPAADYYVLDAGTSADFDGIADFLVLVAAPDPEAVKGVYLALKRFRRSDPELPAGIVVNRAFSPAEGAAVAERVASAAAAFIPGPAPEVLGWVLDDPELFRSEAEGRPASAAAPRSAAAAGVRLCARRLWSRWRPRWSTAA